MGIPVLKQTTEFRVEKGVPLPAGGDGQRKYPFPQMDVGDSFSVTKEGRAAAANAAHHWGKVNGRKFSVRKFDGAYRIWRTA